MFNTTLRRPLVTLTVTAGMLAAAAGPATAQPGNLVPLQWSDPGTLDLPESAHRLNGPASFELVLDGVDIGWVPQTPVATRPGAR